MTPEALAKACAEAMLADDPASRSLGMVLEHVGPGVARMAMAVRADMVNGHGMCHGGFIFTLADSAFAFACNTYNERTVAQHCAVTFLRPAQVGMRLSLFGGFQNATDRHPYALGTYLLEELNK